MPKLDSPVETGRIAVALREGGEWQDHLLIKITPHHPERDRTESEEQHRNTLKTGHLYSWKGNVALLISRSSDVGLADCITHSHATMAKALISWALVRDFSGVGK